MGAWPPTMIDFAIGRQGRRYLFNELVQRHGRPLDEAIDYHTSYHGNVLWNGTQKGDCFCWKLFPIWLLVAFHTACFCLMNLEEGGPRCQ